MPQNVKIKSDERLSYDDLTCLYHDSSHLPIVANATPIVGPTTGCSDLHIITSRASGEPPGEGIISSVVTAIVEGSHQTVIRKSVDYPATFHNYIQSVADGVDSMKTQVAAQAATCPSTKIVLTGFSQGAQVIGDFLAQQGTGLYNKVVAAIMMGDLGHVPGEPFQKGTGNAFFGVILMILFAHMELIRSSISRI